MIKTDEMDSMHDKKPETREIATMTVKRCKPEYLKLAQDNSVLETGTSKSTGVQTLVSGAKNISVNQKESLEDVDQGSDVAITDNKSIRTSEYGLKRESEVASSDNKSIKGSENGHSRGSEQSIRSSVHAQNPSIRTSENDENGESEVASMVNDFVQGSKSSKDGGSEVNNIGSSQNDHNQGSKVSGPNNKYIQGSRNSQSLGSEVASTMNESIPSSKNGQAKGAEVASTGNKSAGSSQNSQNQGDEVVSTASKSLRSSENDKNGESEGTSMLNKFAQGSKSSKGGGSEVNNIGSSQNTHNQGSKVSGPDNKSIQSSGNSQSLGSEVASTMNESIQGSKNGQAKEAEVASTGNKSAGSSRNGQNQGDEVVSTASKSLRSSETIQNQDSNIASVVNKFIQTSENGDNEEPEYFDSNKSIQSEEEGRNKRNNEIKSSISSHITADDPVLSFHDSSYIDYQPTLDNEEDQKATYEDVDFQGVEVASTDDRSISSYENDQNQGAEIVSSNSKSTRSSENGLNRGSNVASTGKKSIKSSENGLNQLAEVNSTDSKSIRGSENSQNRGSKVASMVSKSVLSSENGDKEKAEFFSSDKSIQSQEEVRDKKNGIKSSISSYITADEPVLSFHDSSYFDYQSALYIDEDRKATYEDFDFQGAEVESAINRSISTSENVHNKVAEVFSSSKSSQSSEKRKNDKETQTFNHGKSIQGQKDEKYGEFRSISNHITADDSYRGSQPSLGREVLDFGRSRMSSAESRRKSESKKIYSDRKSSLENYKVQDAGMGNNLTSMKKENKQSIYLKPTPESQISRSSMEKQEENCITQESMPENDLSDDSLTNDDLQPIVMDSPWGEPHRKIRIPPGFFDKKIKPHTVYTKYDLEDDPCKYRVVHSKPLCSTAAQCCPCCERLSPSITCNCVVQTCPPVTNSNSICPCSVPCSPICGPQVYEVCPVFPIYLVESVQPNSSGPSGLSSRKPYAVNVVELQMDDFVTMPQQRPAGVPSNHKWNQKANKDTNNGSLDKHGSSDKPIGRRPPTIICYICGREYGTASIGIHEKQCLEKWRKENSQLPKHKQRPEPVKPQQSSGSSSDTVKNKIPGTGKSSYDIESINEKQFESIQSQYVKCEKCGRTFLPDRLKLHTKNCIGFHKIAAGR